MTISQRPKTPIPVEPVRKGVTPQQRQMIGVAALALCLIIGAGIVWFFLFGASPKRRTVTVDPSKQTMLPPGGARVAIRRDPHGVNQTGDGQWFVRGDSGALRVKKTDAGGYALNFTFPSGFLTMEQVKVISGCIRIQRDAAMAKEWNVTEEQSAKLKQISFAQAAFKPSDADQAALRQLWDAYMNSPGGQNRIDVQKKLTAKLDEIAKANLETARKPYLQRIDQIKQILTPEQVQKITQ